MRFLPTSLRSRLAVLFALGSAAFLIVFTFALYHVLDHQLRSAVDKGLHSRAGDLAAVASQRGELPDRDPFAQVLTRTRIIEHVWDFAYEGGSNVVDVYVRYLREKVDRPFDRADIETVRGVGYRLRSGVDDEELGAAAHRVAAGSAASSPPEAP